MTLTATRHKQVISTTTARQPMPKIQNHLRAELFFMDVIFELFCIRKLPSFAGSHFLANFDIEINDHRRAGTGAAPTKI